MLFEITVVLAFALFAAIGMADAAEWLMRTLFRSKLPCRLFALIPIKAGDADHIETRVRGVLSEACWEAIGADCLVCLVDCGAGPEEKAVCHRLAYSFDSVEYIMPCELCQKATETLERTK